MGYTTYWNTDGCSREKDQRVFEDVRHVILDIFERHRDIIYLEYDEPDKPPLLTYNQIRFNGKEDDGHETFLFELDGSFAFCKTARKPYDLPVCEILLVLKAFLPELMIDSDGFCSDDPLEFDENWPQAIKNVGRYGVSVHAINQTKLKLKNTWEAVCWLD